MTKFTILGIIMMIYNIAIAQNFSKSTFVISPQGSVNVNNKYDNRQNNTTNNFTTTYQNSTNNYFLVTCDTNVNKQIDPLEKFSSNKEYYIDYFSNGLARVKTNNKFGFVNERGNLVIDYKYDKAGIYSEQLMPVCRNEHWYYINSAEQVIFYLPNVTLANSFNNGYAYLFYNSKIALIDHNGTISKKFDNIFGFDSIGLAKVEVEKKFGLINKELEILVTPQYKKIGNFSRIGFAYVVKKKKYGFINLKGAVVLPLEYLYLSDYDNFGYAVAKKRIKYSFSDYLIGYLTLGVSFKLSNAFNSFYFLDTNFAKTQTFSKIIPYQKNIYIVKKYLLSKKYGAFSNG